ncbi:hypothetical protein F7725_018909 [Dissostichus mawsoni]|uniref:Uncharacterized protein n=1 Tax=Dissostichus mawsoni TaxID=36200 RepID=A0A7J5XSY2_DISMA|nr:hypothetical protein F7725_018909 [Dissostichus mawsoni]
MAKALRQLEGNVTVMQKISLLSFCPPSLSLVFVCACRFEKSTSNRDLPEPLSRREKTLPRCSAPRAEVTVRRYCHSRFLSDPGASLTPNKASPTVAKTTAVLAVQENNTNNSQRRSPRCGELKRGYTIAGLSELSGTQYLRDCGPDPDRRRS